VTWKNAFTLKRRREGGRVRAKGALGVVLPALPVLPPSDLAPERLLPLARLRGRGPTAGAPGPNRTPNEWTVGSGPEVPGRRRRTSAAAASRNSARRNPVAHRPPQRLHTRGGGFGRQPLWPSILSRQSDQPCALRTGAVPGQGNPWAHSPRPRVEPTMSIALPSPLPPPKDCPPADPRSRGTAPPPPDLGWMEGGGIPCGRMLLQSPTVGI